MGLPGAWGEAVRFHRSTVFIAVLAAALVASAVSPAVAAAPAPAATSSTPLVAPPLATASGNRPTISGTAEPGDTLTASPGRWSSSRYKIAYAWFVGSTRVEESPYTARYYVPRFEDLGKRITVRITVTPKKGKVRTSKTYTSTPKTVKAPRRTLAPCPTSTFAGFAAGADFALALTSSGVVCGWGENGLGQLGTSTAQYARTAVRVPLTPAVTQIAAGNHHALALTAAGEVYAWGSNSFGQLGMERPKTLRPVVGNRVNTPLSFVPRKVAGLPRIASVVAVDDVSVAVGANGRVYAWGASTESSGDSTSIVTLTSPRQLAGLTNVKKVAADGSRFLALTTNGEVRQWGTWPIGYRADDGTIVTTGGGWVVSRTTSSKKAQSQLSGTRVTDIALNAYAAYAVTDSGTVYGWGSAGSRNLLPGLAWLTLHRSASLLPSLVGIRSVTAAADSAFVVTIDGDVLLLDSRTQPLDGVQTEPWDAEGVRRIVAPAIVPGSVAAAPMWAGALDTRGRFASLARDEYDTYPGYPFRTADNSPAAPSLRGVKISSATAKGCGLGYSVALSSGIPVVVTTTISYGKGRSPYTWVNLEPKSDADNPAAHFGGATGTCKGALTVKATVRATSAWTWKPDGRKWTASASKKWR